MVAVTTPPAISPTIAAIMINNMGMVVWFKQPSEREKEKTRKIQ